MGDSVLHHYFPEWKKGFQWKLTGEKLNKYSQFCVYTYTRDNLNFHIIYFVIAILLISYPNYRIFYNPLKWLCNYIWSKLNLLTFPITIVGIIIYSVILLTVLSLIISSITSLVKMFRKAENSIQDNFSIVADPWIWIGKAIIILIILPVVFLIFYRKKIMYGKLEFYCQLWTQNTSSLSSKFVNCLKSYVIFLNYLLTNEFISIPVALSIIIHVVIGCNLSFIPSTSYVTKIRWLGSSLGLSVIVILLIVTISYNSGQYSEGFGCECWS